MQKLSGLICLIIGGMLVYWGYQMSQAFGARVTNLLSGTPGDKPMLLYIAGAILLTFGLGQMMLKGK
jgi:hypothetical protein